MSTVEILSLRQKKRFIGWYWEKEKNKKILSEAWVDFSIVLFWDQVMAAVGVVDGLILKFWLLNWELCWNLKDNEA